MKNKSHQQILLRSLLTLISQLGSSALAMGDSLFIFQKTDSSISFGLNMIAAPLVTVLLSPIIGKIIDSFNHKSIIIICQIVSIATLLFYIAYFQILDNQILFLTIFVVIVLKIADEFVLLSLYASSINIVHEEEQQKLRSWQQISANCAAITSPVIGATLYGAIPFNLFILAVVFTEFISLILVIAINFRFVVKEESTDGKNDFKDDEKLNLFKWLSKQSYLKDIVFLATVVSSIDTVIYIATPIIILNILEFSNIYYSVAMSTLILGELLSSLIISRKKQETSPLKNGYSIMLGSTLAMSFLGFSTFFSNKPIAFSFILLSLFSMTFVESFFTIPLQVWYVTEIPEKIQGRIFAFLGAIISFFSPLSTLMFSGLYEIKTLPLQQINTIIIFSAVSIRLISTIYLKFIKKVNLANAHVLKY